MGVDLGDGTWATRDPETGDVVHVATPAEAMRASFRLRQAIEKEQAELAEKRDPSKD